MKLKNNGGSFIVIFTGKDYTVPSGEFEVFSDPLGYFILNKAEKWGKDVVPSGGAKTEEIRQDVVVPEITPVEPIVAPETKEEKKARKEAEKMVEENK